MNQASGNGGARPRYITPEGEQALRKELQYLWKEKRPQVTQTVREAAALGDRSENAEYLWQETVARDRPEGSFSQQTPGGSDRCGSAS